MTVWLSEWLTNRKKIQRRAWKSNPILVRRYKILYLRIFFIILFYVKILIFKSPSKGSLTRIRASQFSSYLQLVPIKTRVTVSNGFSFSRAHRCHVLFSGSFHSSSDGNKGIKVPSKPRLLSQMVPHLIVRTDKNVLTLQCTYKAIFDLTRSKQMHWRERFIISYY